MSGLTLGLWALVVAPRGRFVALLAWDDTDGPDGGCTTHTLFAVLQALPGLAPRGMPRLVRLNPNVPWKTRGNGAVAVELVIASGPSVGIGEFRGFQVHAYPDGPPVAATNELIDAAWAAVSQAREEGAESCMVAVDEAPPAIAYLEAVQTEVDPTATRTTAKAFGLVRGEGRGIVGALAAAAWPGPATSYEFIAYRTPPTWGTPRALERDAFRSLDGTGATFHSWDPEADKAACIPNTPCPVLCGLRGHNPEALQYAATHTLQRAAREPVDAWMLWATNQGSGDHVVPVRTLAEAPPMATVEVEATVIEAPETRPGGHVFVAMREGFQAAAFEPTKGFRKVAEALQPGDRVVATGAYADGVVRLEKLEILEAPRRVRPSEHCGRAMQSAGAGAGWRCRECGAVSEEVVEASPLVGSYEVPVMARRHLHRPMA